MKNLVDRIAALEHRASSSSALIISIEWGPQGHWEQAPDGALTRWIRPEQDKGRYVHESPTIDIPPEERHKLVQTLNP